MSNPENYVGGINLVKVYLKDGGPAGLSAYELAVNEGYSGTLEEWLESIRGEDADIWTIGIDGYWYRNGNKTSTRAEGVDADVWTIGNDGYWYKNGVKQDTKAEIDDWTVGADSFWYKNGTKTDKRAKDDWTIDDDFWYKNGVKTPYPSRGRSAYELWLEEGYEGDYQDFLNSLKGGTRLEPIYGAVWNKVSSPTLTRINQAVDMVAEPGVDNEITRNDFDAAEIFGECEDWTDSYGNVFIKIPKFYIRKVDYNNFKSWQVSKKRYPGFYLPNVFWDFEKRVELPYFYFGKYKASLSDDGKRLESKPGKFPLVSETIVKFREYAEANNTEDVKGYHQRDIHGNDVIETLFIIAMATLNSQSKMAGFTDGLYSSTYVTLEEEEEVNRVILTTAHAKLFRVGQTIACGTAAGNSTTFNNRIITEIIEDEIETGKGSIYFDGEPVDITAGKVVWNGAYKTGSTDNVFMSSGSPVSNSNGKYTMKFLGIEGIYGDIYEWVDGINIDDYQTYVCDDSTKYASNLFTTPYRPIGYVNSSTSSEYIKEMGFDPENPAVSLPITVAGGAGSNAYYSDRYYCDVGKRVALVGGNWYSGSRAGVFLWYLSTSSASAFVDGGGRLLKKAL